MKKFYATKYKPFWTDGINHPKEHIETFLDDKGFFWYPLNNNIQWDFPQKKLILTGTTSATPPYIKCVDGTETFYFYHIGPVNVVAVKDDKNYYTQEYLLDDYMTSFLYKFQLLVDNDVKVNFTRKFFDRFEYIADGDVIGSAKLNYWTQPHLTKEPLDTNFVKHRQFVYGTTAQKMLSLNYPTVTIPPSITVPFWHTNTGATFNTANWSLANGNKRYLYLVCKSSALQSTSGSDTDFHTDYYADNTKCIVPIITGQEPIILNNLLNFNPTGTYGDLLNAVPNTVGFYELPIPPSLLLAKYISQGSVSTNEFGMYAAYNGGGDTGVIPFFKVDANTAFKWELLNWQQYSTGLDGKLREIFLGAFNKWTPETESLFLSPAYYKEKYQIDNNNFLFTDMTMIEYNVQGSTINDNGLSMNVWVFFDSNVSMSYAFGDYTNHFNTYWNSNLSNLITQVSLTGSLYDSASANYYSNNATSLYTSIENRKSEQTQNWLDYGFDTARTLTTTAGSMSVFPWNWHKNAAKIAAGAIDIAKGGVDTAMENERANRQVTSQVKNIATAQSTAVSSPYVFTCIPSTSENGDYLFNTYTEQIAEFEKPRIFMDICTNGYVCNVTLPISSYENRQFMNVLNITTSENYANIWRILQNDTPSVFNNPAMNSEFIGWLSAPKKIWRENEMYNCFDYQAANYVSNIEIALPPLPQQKINIAKFLTIRDITTSEVLTPELIFNSIIENNQPLPPYCDDFSINNVSITFNASSYTITVNLDDEKYFGTINGVIYTGGGLYLTDGTYIPQNTVTSQDFANKLCNSSSHDSTIKVLGVSVVKDTIYGVKFLDDGTLTSIGNYFLYDCRNFNQPLTLPNSITSIGDSFLRNCTSFNQPLTLPNSVTSLGNSFLINCIPFNQPLTLPNSVTSLGNSFLFDCAYFNQPLTLPNSLTYVGTYFLSRTNNLTSPINIQNIPAAVFADSVMTCTVIENTVPAYTIGMTIVGTYANDFRTRFPNSPTSPYRKLI